MSYNSQYEKSCISYILYYSNFCQHSKVIIQKLTKSPLLSKDIHFICVDNRVSENGETYILLGNNKKIILPNNINRVPALLKLDDYNVYFGENINEFFKFKEELLLKSSEESNNQTVINQSSTHSLPQTKNYNDNMDTEPSSYSFYGNGTIVSDNYSFLDSNAEDLSSKGDGGMRQMYHYVSLYDNEKISTPTDGYSTKNEKLPSDLTIEQLQKQRDNDIPTSKKIVF